MAIALKDNKTVAAGSDPNVDTTPAVRRWTIRNLTGSSVTMKFYQPDDTLEWATLPNGTQTIGAHQERAFPALHFTGAGLKAVTSVKIDFSNNETCKASVGQLVTIVNADKIEVTAYKPPFPVE